MELPLPKKIIHTILDILFPLYCVGCTKGGSAICENCVGNFLSTPQDHEGVFCTFSYQSPLVKRAIHALKFEGYRLVGDALGKIWYDELIPYLFEDNGLVATAGEERIAIIPIPLGKKRLSERGYNQSEILARGFVSKDPDRFEVIDDVLYKIKDTERQVVVKDRSNRLKNLKDIFEVRNEERLKNRVIFLFDDVTTTGATLSEARHALKKAGAKHVQSFAFAH